MVCQIGVNNRNQKLWYCECDCGNKKIATTSDLNSKRIQSCGCLKSEMLSKRNKKYNIYDLTGEYGIGYTSKGDKFYFDLEDYDKIKNYCWYTDKDGYLKTIVNGQNILMHNIIMDIKEALKNNIVVDHIKHKNYDNRKSKLRIITFQQNAMNHKPASDNTSGVTGVDYDKNAQKWRSRIEVNNKRIELGFYFNFEDAVQARKEAEEEYYDIYSYDNSMKGEQNY